MQIHELTALARQMNASDIHISQGTRPTAKRWICTGWTRILPSPRPTAPAAA